MVMMRMVVAAIVVLALAASCGGRQDVPIEVSPRQLVRDFKADARGAEKKYDRPVILTDTVFRVQGTGLRLVGEDGVGLEVFMKYEWESRGVRSRDQVRLLCEKADTGGIYMFTPFIHLRGCELF